MKKKLVAAESAEGMKFIIRFRDEQGVGSKTLFLDELLQGEMNGAMALIGEVKIQDTGDMIRNAYEVTHEMSKNNFNSKLCSIILHDEKGEKYSEEFYSSCIAKDVEKPITEFFSSEGGSLVNSIAGVVFGPLLKIIEGKMIEGQN